MVVTDGIHLAGSNLDELHAFARAVGIRFAWFHDHPRHPHYDILSEPMLQRVLDAGARRVSSKDIVRLCKAAFEGIDDF